MGAKCVGFRELGILSDEWWVTKIEWGVMSDEKKKKPNSPKIPLGNLGGKNGA